MSIPNFLQDALEKQIMDARSAAQRDYDETIADQRKHGQKFVSRPCWTCGRTCPVEVESKDDKYAPCCRSCFADLMADLRQAEVAEQMSVC